MTRDDFDIPSESFRGLDVSKMPEVKLLFSEDYATKFRELANEHFMDADFDIIAFPDQATLQHEKLHLSIFNMP